METVWVEDHPKAVDQVVGTGECTFERWRREAEAQGQSPWAPFKEREWQLQRWLAKTTGQNDIQDFLKLDIVSITYLLQSMVELMNYSRSKISNSPQQASIPSISS